jgi:hypothetical protein
VCCQPPGPPSDVRGVGERGFPGKRVMLPLSLELQVVIGEFRLMENWHGEVKQFIFEF